MKRLFLTMSAPGMYVVSNYVEFLRPLSDNLTFFAFLHLGGFAPKD